jgi:hypothetical protein
MQNLWIVASFIFTHREEIGKFILFVQDVYGDLAGPEKAKVVKEFIAKATGVGDKIGDVWPMVAPLFDRLVAKVKGKV